MSWTDSIEKPTLILDPRICRANIRRMATKSKNTNTLFRPHCKTHQSRVVSEWLRQEDIGNVKAITVSSVEMATYFAKNGGGWNDITIAFTVNVRQIDAINRLLDDCNGTLKLGLIVESIETVLKLQEQLRHPVSLWIDVDTGYHRTGIDWQASAEILALAQAIEAGASKNNTTRLAGLLTHPGHTYKATSLAEVQAIHDETIGRITAVRDMLLASPGLSTTTTTTRLQISIGDTPTCSMMQDFGPMVDEIRPGNFVFYDVMQANIGACRLTDVAVAVACPVVAKHPHLQQLVLYGGAVHLSKDRIVEAETGQTIFGRLAKATESGWDILEISSGYVKGLSQEHGLVHASEELLKSVSIGDILLVLPIHSCLTANLLKKYVCLDDGKAISMAPIPPNPLVES